MPKPSHSSVRLIEAYLDHLDSMGRSPITVYNYRLTLGGYLVHLGDEHVARARSTDVREFISRPRNRRSGKRPAGATALPATLKRELAAIRGFYRFAASIPGSGITLNPTELVDTPRVRNIHPKAIAVDVWREVWFSEELSDDEIVMLGLGFFCGLRRAEMVGLQRSNVNWQRLSFDGFARKGGGDDTFRFGSAIAAWTQLHPHLIGSHDRFLGPLDRLCNRQGDADTAPAVLPWADGADSHARHRTPAGHASPEVVNKRFRLMFMRLGLGPQTFTPHALRHSFVTYLLQGGVPLHEVSSLANHSDLSTTMRYVKQSEDPLSRFHQGLEWRPKWR